MTTAVILLWAGCLWSIARGVLCLFLTAAPWRRILVLAAALLSLAACHTPDTQNRPPA